MVLKREKRHIRVEGSVAYVPLTRGYEAIIDASDVHIAELASWHAKVCVRADGSVRSVYARRFFTVKGGKCANILLHRDILAAPDGLEVDHINGNGLDNRRVNLRLATRQQNSQNARTGAANTSGFKGVNFHKGTGKFRAFIKLNGKQKSLGYFLTAEGAASAYRSASADFHGEFGRADG